MIFPFGSLVNGLAIVVGGAIGLVLGARMPEKMRELVFQGLGLCILVLGLQSALEGTRPLVTIMGIVLGSVVGEWLGIEDTLSRIGDALKKRVGSPNPRFTEGLVNASLMFCIGAMGIVASLQEGLSGTRDIVYAKSVIDFFAAAILATGLGFGVLFSGISVFLYQGSIVLAAAALTYVFSDAAIAALTAEISATGGILMMSIGLNTLALTHIRIANMLPAVVISPILYSFFP